MIWSKKWAMITQAIKSKYMQAKNIANTQTQSLISSLTFLSQNFSNKNPINNDTHQKIKTITLLLKPCKYSAKFNKKSKIQST